MKNSLFFPVIFLMALAGQAQTEQELLSQLLEVEKNTVEALVLYPADTRIAILEAARFPEVLIRMDVMQEKTSAAFKELMNNYTQETQEMVWDITRYPGLVSKLVASGQLHEESLEASLADYPVEVQDRAIVVWENHFELLLNVNDLTVQSERAFADLIGDYPGSTQDAFRQLIQLPEILSLLTEDIRLTVLVGDLYDKNPDWLLQQLDSLNLVVAREHAKEVEDWKAGIEANPEVQEELVSSTQAFADEYGYDDDYYDYDEIYYNRNEVILEHYYYHYPYWLGYPHWYVFPRWRPYPYWYDWGFYWGPGQVLVIIDLPSFYFTDWYFYYPHHHHYYPHLSSNFANHYYGHRTSSTSVVSSVRDWKYRNREVITDDWLENSRKSPDRFREYGKFETERLKYNRAHPDKQLSSGDFLDRNERKYPSLSKEQVRKERVVEEQATRKQPAEPTMREPRIQLPKTKDPAVPSRRPDVNEPRRKTDMEPKTKPNDIPKIDKARDYHRDKWEKSPPQKQRELAKPRTQPAPPKIKPERKAPVKKSVKKGKNG